VATGGAQGDAASHGPSLSSDGRYVAFTSSATNLVRGDTNGVPDVFVRDRWAGVTTRVSVASDGTQGNGPSGATAAYGSRVAVSGNGRYVAFTSAASNLVDSDRNDSLDVFVHDRVTHATIRASVSSEGGSRPGESAAPAISADGRWITYASTAGDAGDGNLAWDIVLFDRWGQSTSRISVPAGGGQANGGSGDPAISANGRYVTFHSSASNLVPGDTNGLWDVFVFDRWTHRTSRISTTDTGAQSNGDSSGATISADGRYVSYMSSAANLAEPGWWGFGVFVTDRVTHHTTRVPYSPYFGDPDEISQVTYGAVISPDGRYAAFGHALSLADGAGIWYHAIVVYDRWTGAFTYRRADAAGHRWEDLDGPAIAAGGRFLAYSSVLADVAPHDTNGATDIFVQQRY
jgi:Tol biopolymer transport system component